MPGKRKLPKRKLLRIIGDIALAGAVIALIKGERITQVLKKKGKAFFTDKGT